MSALDDLQFDIGNLHYLLDVIADNFLELNFGPTNNRVPGLDRLNALAWIARDLSAALEKQVEANYSEIGQSATNLDEAIKTGGTKC